MSYEAGALCEPLACAVQAVLELTRVRAGDLAFVSGPGLMGLLTAQLAKAEGAIIVIAGLPGDEERLVLARDLGMDHTVVVGKYDIEAIVRRLSDGYGVCVAFECAGAEGSLKQCLSLVSQRGRLTQIGVMSRPVMIDFNHIFFKQLEMRASFGHNWRSWDRALALLAQGKVHMEPLISAQLPLHRWQEAFSNLQNRVGVRTVLYPTD